MTPGRPRVLIVDDYPSIVKSVSRLLALDCEVVGNIPDCRGLIEAVDELEPDVIILDVNLPGGNALESCRQLARDYPDVKVIVFTAADNPDMEARSLEAGATAFVHKLATDGDLLSAIRRLRRPGG
jgi:DNA-binding NarL/FixJ family response regulator